MPSPRRGAAPHDRVPSAPPRTGRARARPVARHSGGERAASARGGTPAGSGRGARRRLLPLEQQFGGRASQARPKLVKRTSYGRASDPLLHRRVLAARAAHKIGEQLRGTITKSAGEPTSRRCQQTLVSCVLNRPPTTAYLAAHRTLPVLNPHSGTVPLGRPASLIRTSGR